MIAQVLQKATQHLAGGARVFHHQDARDTTGGHGGGGGSDRECEGESEVGGRGGGERVIPTELRVGVGMHSGGGSVSVGGNW
eukprot:CAMPEP_0173280072 /NCGR_PEP_ID=MMETSP1143-20121109/5489_1 /TAXON_ID=483371 /ORGANISM="non described non described, Strain CCMP2298" /LENGTH=81 /DNA_ID=CAMNT_0014217347 /DNA_START=32 /DNA_END=277 /DNA_ORIENTATION=-